MNILFVDANEAIEYIHSLHRFGKKSGLSNIKLILERLGNPQKDLKFVHIAGTNGKGSVSNMIKNILKNHGYKVGFYTSPYIEFFSERICINDELISDSDLVYYAEKVREVIYDINPIEFEFITCMGFLYFKDKKCDIVVLEAGLGGRLDSTNVIDTPVLNVITSIGLDHTEILGESLTKIAFEKAGIIKENSDVVISQNINDECVKVIEKRCIECGATLIMPTGKVENEKFSLSGTTFSYKGEEYFLSLKGTYQIQNAVTAIESAHQLSKTFPLTKEDIKDGLKNSNWKCRFEIFDTSPVTVLDGAHNSNGISVLMQSIETYFPNKKRIFLFSMLSEKDWEESVDLISKHTDTVILTKVPSLRETETDGMIKRFSKKNVNCMYIEDYVEAYKKAKEISKGKVPIFVFGSLYLAGGLRKYVE